MRDVSVLCVCLCLSPMPLCACGFLLWLKPQAFMDILLKLSSERQQAWSVGSFSGNVSLSVHWAALHTMVLALVLNTFQGVLQMEHLSFH